MADILMYIIYFALINSLVPDAHYSECPDKQQIKLIEATLQLNFGFFVTCALMG